MTLDEWHRLERKRVNDTYDAEAMRIQQRRRHALEQLDLLVIRVQETWRREAEGRAPYDD